MSVEQDYRPDLKGLPGHAFQTVNPASYGRTQGNPNVIEALRIVEKRTDQIRQKMQTHFEKYKQNWIAKEAISIWQKRSEISAKYPAPDFAKNDALKSESIMRHADMIVSAKMTKRFMKLNQIKSKMENAVIRNAEHMHEDIRMQEQANMHERPDVNLSKTYRQTQKNSLKM